MMYQTQGDNRPKWAENIVEQRNIGNGIDNMNIDIYSSNVT